TVRDDDEHAPSAKAVIRARNIFIVLTNCM
ncbi:MAG: hypothetical protein ACI8RO_000930, partial [Flavobacteriales bacterium]